MIFGVLAPTQPPADAMQIDSPEAAASAASAATASLLKSAPPLAVAGFTFLGHSLDTWVQVAALIWIFLQMGGWAYDRWKR